MVDYTDESNISLGKFIASKNNVEEKFLLIGYLDTYEEYFQPMKNYPVKELKTNKINYMLW